MRISSLSFLLFLWITAIKAFDNGRLVTIESTEFEQLKEMMEMQSKLYNSSVIAIFNDTPIFVLSGHQLYDLKNSNSTSENKDQSQIYYYNDNANVAFSNSSISIPLTRKEIDCKSNNSIDFQLNSKQKQILTTGYQIEGSQFVKSKVQQQLSIKPVNGKSCFILKDSNQKADSEVNHKARKLAGQFLNQDGDAYPGLKGLGTTIVVVTCIAAFIFYLGHILKSQDSSLFWILLSFIQLTYLTLMIELYHPLNLIYFLDRLEPCKLDIAWIEEFTTIRDSLMKDMSFKADRIYFGQIEFDYGSMMVNLAYYWRLIISVLIVHFIFKLLSLLRNDKNKSNFAIKFIMRVKMEIYEVFYVRYLVEVSVFLWIGVIIEFVSTSREWTLQQLSLSFDICLIIFLIVFNYMFIWASIMKKTKESKRGFYMSFFLIKRALWAIFIVSFAYINREAQLSVLFAIQVVSIALEILFRPGNCIFHTICSVFSNIVFLVYLGILYLFIDSKNQTTEKGNIAAIFVSVYIIFYATCISIFGTIRLVLALFKKQNEEKKCNNDEFKTQIKNASQSHYNNLQSEEHPHAKDEELKVNHYEKHNKTNSNQDQYNKNSDSENQKLDNSTFKIHNENGKNSKSELSNQELKSVD